MIAQLRANHLLANNTAQGKRVAQIGRRVTGAVEQYLRANGMQDKLQYLNWEFNLINTKDINAFALPGGKIAFYSGILPVLQTDGAIAFVMGHEIGHVIGGHHAEGASGQSLAGFLITGSKPCIVISGIQARKEFIQPFLGFFLTTYYFYQTGNIIRHHPKIILISRFTKVFTKRFPRSVRIT